MGSSWSEFDTIECEEGEEPVSEGPLRSHASCAPSACPGGPAECAACSSGGSFDGGIPVVGGACEHFCSAYGYCGTTDVYKNGGTDCTFCAFRRCENCRSSSHPDGGVQKVNGFCQDFCSAAGWCGNTDVYKSGGTDCTKFVESSSGTSRSNGASLSIIIPAVIAPVLLFISVLYLVRKRRVAAATPDGTPKLDTEAQVEA